MKRKEDDPVTIWDAALVKGVENCQTLHEWLTIIQSGDKSRSPSYTSDELGEKMENGNKKPTESKRMMSMMSTFIVGIKPSSRQKIVLNHMLRTSNHAYNYCNHLVQTGAKEKASMNDLQGVVAKKDSNPDFVYQGNPECFFLISQG